MSFIKKFKSFLEIINVNYEEFADCSITDKNGEEYLFSQMNEERIKTFDWAYFLAQKNQIILLNNDQDTMDSIDAINGLQGGVVSGQGKHYFSEKKSGDYERFEYAKDLFYLIRDIFGGVHFGKLEPMYLEDGSADNFLICIAKVPHTDALAEKYTKGVKKSASRLGLYTFPISCVFPKRLVKPGFCKDCEADGILIKKNSYNKDRNAALIAELKAKQREKRAKQMDFIMSEADETKYTEKAKKLYNEIKKYGLDGLSREDPPLGIEDFLVGVFKVLLYKKWASYKDIVELEINDGYFFHMYEDGFEIPSKQDLIFDIADAIKDRC